MALVSRDNYNASGVHRHLTAISSRLLHQPRGTHDSMLNTVTEVMQQNWRTPHKYVGFLCAEHQRDVGYPEVNAEGCGDAPPQARQDERRRASRVA